MARTAIMVKRFFKLYAKEKLYQVEWTDDDDDKEVKLMNNNNLARSGTRRWKNPKKHSNEEPLKEIYQMLPPREPSTKLIGQSRMAAYLKYFIEYSAYMKMASEGNTDINLASKKKKGANNIFHQVHLNYVSKMNEVNDMKELLQTMIKEKTFLIAQIFNETAFKVKIPVGEEEEEEEERLTESVDRRFTLVMQKEAKREEEFSQIFKEMKRLIE